MPRSPAGAPAAAILGRAAPPAARDTAPCPRRRRASGGRVAVPSRDTIPCRAPLQLRPESAAREHVPGPGIDAAGPVRCGTSGGRGGGQFDGFPSESVGRTGGRSPRGLKGLGPIRGRAIRQRGGPARRCRRAGGRQRGLLIVGKYGKAGEAPSRARVWVGNYGAPCCAAALRFARRRLHLAACTTRRRARRTMCSCRSRCTVCAFCCAFCSSKAGSSSPAS
jgi:hypothetical protein